MMAMLVDPMFHYWTLTGDGRIPGMVLRWLDFLGAKVFSRMGEAPTT